MKKITLLVVPFGVLATAALAVYAPIPEQEQGKALSYRLGASIYHDSNIFGAATGEISSMVYSVSPAIVFNSSVTDQTFVSATYEANIDHMVDRPTRQNLISHTLTGRLAHKISDSTNIDLNDIYQISKNPQSLLAGIPLNGDQSFKRNEFDARLNTAAGQKTGVVLKFRNVIFDYDTPTLSASLDRMENLAGIELSHALLPETKLVGEYRYQDIAYDTGGGTKDKKSHFALIGIDHSPAENITLSGRAGLEDRLRSGAPDTTAPYAELSARYAYAEGSYLAGGYTYTLEESSDTATYTDTKVNRLFVNLQHRLTALITASGSLTYEPSRLNGRSGFASINEDTTRAGLALSWLPNKNLTITGTLDVDHIDSDDPNRNQDRTRFGVTARLAF